MLLVGPSARSLLGFEGPWIAMGDWNMEPAKVTGGKVEATTDATCAGGAGSCLGYPVVSAALAHLVQGVVRVENSPTTPHWPVRLFLKATSRKRTVLARQQPSPYPSEMPIGPRRQEEPFDWALGDGRLA